MLETVELSGDGAIQAASEERVGVKFCDDDEEEGDPDSGSGCASSSESEFDSSFLVPMTLLVSNGFEGFEL